MSSNGPAWYSGTINLAKNEDWRVQLQYNVDYTVSGDPENIQSLDLTGSTISLQIRKKAEDKSAIVTITNGDGVTLSEPVIGMFELMISRAKSARLHAGEYVADLIREDANGYVERMWEGAVEVVEGVTRGVTS